MYVVIMSLSRATTNKIVRNKNFFIIEEGCRLKIAGNESL